MEQLARVERLEQELGREQVGALACLINNSNICAGIVEVVVVVVVVVVVAVVVVVVVAAAVVVVVVVPFRSD